MKIKLSSFIFIVLISIGMIIMAVQVYEMEQQKELEEKRSTVIQLLQEDLGQLNPTLEKFVDNDYITVIASKISDNGICEFERGLNKNQDPFGILTVEYDLENMKVTSQELTITNKDYANEWKNFKGKFE